MKENRDKFLTEAMGLCWHEYNEDKWGCFKCGTNAYMIKGHWLGTPKGHSIFKPINPDFSTWQGFGTLLPLILSNSLEVEITNIEVALLKRKKHRTWEEVARIKYKEHNDIPNIVADALFLFLKERE